MEVVTVLTGGVSFEQAEKYLPYVSALRRDRIAKKRGSEDKLLSLTAGLLLSLEISSRTGIPRDKIRYTHGSYGKPYLEGGELYFSLSHTAGAVCAAFSDEENGVDIERRNRHVSERIRSRILSGNEKPLVRTGEDLLRIWVQKEAFLKRLGTGIADDLRGADTTLMHDTAAFDCGEYLLGVSGRGAAEADIRVMGLAELLARYDSIHQ